jgi:hypothetical protein
MMKSGIDQDALIKAYSQASAQHGEALRKAVADATLKALQGRELTLENIRKVVKTVTQAASTGIVQNPGGADVEGLMDKTLAGIDAALLQAVEANRRALQQFVDQGAGLQEKQFKEALANVEKIEDAFFSAATKAAQAAGGPLLGPWQQALDALREKGTDTGARASTTVEQLMAQAQHALRDSRASSLRAAEALMQSYSALVSGVLIGMSEGLQGRTTSPGSAAPDEAAPAAASAKSRKPR